MFCDCDFRRVPITPVLLDGGVTVGVLLPQQYDAVIPVAEDRPSVSHQLCTRKRNV